MVTRYAQKPKEKDIERKACARILQELGVFSIKLAKTQEDGYPDREFLIPGGVPLFIEFKRPGEVPTERQLLMHERLRYAGYDVCICSSVESAVSAVKKFVRVSYVYVHCRPSGEPFYVGKGFLARTKNFLKSRNPHYTAVVRKYGAENIQVFIHPCATEEDALAYEMYLIDYLRKSGCRLTNMTDGGEGSSGRKGSVLSEAARAAISEAHRGKKLTAAHINKLSAASRARWRRPEEREKISAAMRGRSLSEAHKQKISKRHKGKVVSEETRSKISASLRKGSK